jgi:hypothetical protein
LAEFFSLYKLQLWKLWSKKLFLIQ